MMTSWCRHVDLKTNNAYVLWNPFVFFFPLSQSLSTPPWPPFCVYPRLLLVSPIAWTCSRVLSPPKKKPQVYLHQRGINVVGIYNRLARRVLYTPRVFIVCLCIYNAKYSVATFFQELAVSVFKGKPRTSWQFFLNDHKDRFLDENGKYKLIEATKALSVEWKQMTEAQKKVRMSINDFTPVLLNIKITHLFNFSTKPYVERYLAENAEYQRTMNTAVTQIPPLEIAKENALRRHFDIQPLKDPRQPKRPKNAYLYFFEHVRNTSEELKKLSSTKEQAARTGEMWRALSDDEKKVRSHFHHMTWTLYERKNV